MLDEAGDVAPYSAQRSLRRTSCSHPWYRAGLGFRRAVSERGRTRGGHGGARVCSRFSSEQPYRKSYSGKLPKRITCGNFMLLA